MAVTDIRTETNGACRMRIQHDVVDSVDAREGRLERGRGRERGEGQYEKERRRFEGKGDVLLTAALEGPPACMER